MIDIFQFRMILKYDGDIQNIWPTTVYLYK